MFSLIRTKKSTTCVTKNNYGFSLVELLVVVAILAILAAIAIPLFLNQKQKAADQAVYTGFRNLATEANVYKGNADSTMETGLTLNNTINASGFRLTSPSAATIIPNCTLNGGTTASKSAGNFVIIGARTNSSGVWISGIMIYDSKSSKTIYASSDNANYVAAVTSVGGTGFTGLIANGAVCPNEASTNPQTLWGGFANY